MSDTQQVFSKEIRRIARREMNSVLKPVLAQNVELRKKLTNLERTFKALQKQFPDLERPNAKRLTMQPLSLQKFLALPKSAF